MADAVTTKVIENTPKEYVVHLTNISDGTGEAAVIKVDKSALTDINGVEPSLLAIERARWCIQGMTSVHLLFDHNTDEVVLVLAGNGEDDFVSPANSLRDRLTAKGIEDGAGTGGTGDLLLTTNGHVSGGSYDITLWLRKKAA